MKDEDTDRQKHLEEEKQIYTGRRGKGMLEMGRAFILYHRY